MNKYVLVLLFFVTAGSLSAMERLGDLSREDVRVRAARTQLAIAQVKSKAKKAKPFFVKREGEDSPWGSWKSELTGAIALFLIVGLME